MVNNKLTNLDFPTASAPLEIFGLKFTPGGPHISRTMMLAELGAVLTSVPQGSRAGDYRDAILVQNVLGKATDSTRIESLRRLRELYALDEAKPIFGLLIKLYAVDPASLPLLAVQVAFGRDPTFRSTAPAVIDAAYGARVDTASITQAFAETFPNQYSELSQGQTGRHAASSWTQSGHLLGRTKKTRQRVKPTPAAVTMALLLGSVSGYNGATVFSNPWCRLLDLDADRARGLAQDAHRAGLLTLRAVGEVVEISFPLFSELQGNAS
jgi:hypothetical protein